MQFRFQSASPTIRQSNEIQNVCRGLFLVSGSVLLRAGVSQLGFRFRLERRERGYGDMAFTSSSSLAAPSSSSPSPSRCAISDAPDSDSFLGDSGLDSPAPLRFPSLTFPFGQGNCVQRAALTRTHSRTGTHNCSSVSLQLQSSFFYSIFTPALAIFTHFSGGTFL